MRRRWRGLAAAALSAWAAPALAAPGGTCADAISVDALPFATSATTCGTGNDFTNDTGGTAVCADLPKGYGGEDVFYKVVLGPGNKLAFDLTMPGGATGDLALFLVRQPSCAEPPVCAANSVDLIGAGLGPERIKLQSYPSGTYYLIVDSALPSADPGQCGAYNLTVTGHLSEFCGNGIVEAGELCDDGNNDDTDCCSSDCKSQKTAGTTCRGVAGPCDVAEVCDGSGHCPTDKFRDSTTSCRPSTGTCDVTDFCTGVGPSCPTDGVAPFGLLCRAPAGPCDQAEVCTGSSTSCPLDVMLPTGTVCGTGTICTQPARCAGAPACPAPQPINCNDGNPCTRDVCDLVASCLHVPICLDAGMDATTDVRPDGPADLAPDLGADMSLGPDAMMAPDLPAPMPDAGQPDLRADAPSSEAAAAVPAKDARPDEGQNSMDSLANGKTVDMRGPEPAEAGTDGDDGTHRLPPDAASDAVADLRGPTDPFGAEHVASTGGGCSCRLDSSSSREESLAWALPVLALGVGIARRRRRQS
jgi:MYXO-CTERM domain-containing protein